MKISTTLNQVVIAPGKATKLVFEAAGTQYEMENEDVFNQLSSLEPEEQLIMTIQRRQQNLDFSDKEVAANTEPVPEYPKEYKPVGKLLLVYENLTSGTDFEKLQKKGWTVLDHYHSWNQELHHIDFSLICRADAVLFMNGDFELQNRGREFCQRRGIEVYGNADEIPFLEGYPLNEESALDSNLEFADTLKPGDMIIKKPEYRNPVYNGKFPPAIKVTEIGDDYIETGYGKTKKDKINSQYEIYKKSEETVQKPDDKPQKGKKTKQKEEPERTLANLIEDGCPIINSWIDEIYHDESNPHHRPAKVLAMDDECLRLDTGELIAKEFYNKWQLAGEPLETAVTKEHSEIEHVDKVDIIAADMFNDNSLRVGDYIYAKNLPDSLVQITSITKTGVLTDISGFIKAGYLEHYIFAHNGTVEVPEEPTDASKSLYELVKDGTVKVGSLIRQKGTIGEPIPITKITAFTIFTGEVNFPKTELNQYEYCGESQEPTEETEPEAGSEYDPFAGINGTDQSTLIQV